MRAVKNASSLRRMSPGQPNDTAVVISSCDAFSDLWDPSLTLFFRYWPDCPYDVYLVTNEVEYAHPRVASLKAGKDTDWTSTFRRAVQQINHDKLIVMMEDMLLVRKVGTERLRGFIDYMQERKAGAMRLVPIPPPDYPTGDHPELGEIATGVRYRVSLHPTVWDRTTLFQILRDGESAWDLEWIGSGRSDTIERSFLCIREDARPVLEVFPGTAVIKGRWMPDAIAFCRAQGVPVDLSRRSVETRSQTLRRQLSIRIRDQLASAARAVGLR